MSENVMKQLNKDDNDVKGLEGSCFIWRESVEHNRRKAAEIRKCLIVLVAIQSIRF